MQFTSYTFILVVLPVCIIGYYLASRINNSLGKLFLAGISLGVYVCAGMRTTAIFVASIAVNMLFCLLLRKLKTWRKLILISGISLNILILLYFKYFNFILSSVTNLLNRNYEPRDIVLPVAISFFTFQQIALLVNTYWGKLEGYNWLDYSLYILYFPKVMMGPISEPEPLMKQFNDSSLKKFSLDNLASGLRIFGYGLFKKMVLADTFASAFSWVMSNMDQATSMDLIISILSYTFEIYFDFSGYSDMAVGVSQMLNIELPINFDSPYKALSIRDFWKRWHISLTAFFTKYIYIPMGGSKKGKVRTYVNTMVVFLISGLWHGANWTFILWGALHGLLSVFDRIFDKLEKKVFEPVRWFITFSCINVLWFLFAVPDIFTWKTGIKKILSFSNMSISEGWGSCFYRAEGEFLFNIVHLDMLTQKQGFWPISFLVTAFIICLIPENNYKLRKNISIVGALLGGLAFIWGFICLGNDTSFVYYGF